MAERIKLPSQVAAIYRAVTELETAYPGRKFTPDGHLVGSIGEVIAKEAFGLELLPMSAPLHDARCKVRGDVQIKTTAGDGVDIKGICNHLIVLRIDSPETATVVYDGPGKPAWDNAGKISKAGERRISLSKLRKLATGISNRDTAEAR
jgi:hypothetical protein